MQNVIAVAIGGALGALGRYGALVACVRWFAAPTVYATWAVNIVGCFAIGLLAGSPLGQRALANAAIGIGFLGGLTTFSTFGLETIRLFESGSTVAALTNIGTSMIVGLFAVTIGLLLGRLL
jgi:fluoride exporter